MNIEKGMYVRTDMGNILKYEDKLKEFIDEHISIENGKDIEYIGTMKKEPSFNLIDLIELDDWIYVEIPCSLETSGILKAVNIVDYDYLIRLKVDKDMQSCVKSIITHEQIKANEYKVQV